MSDEEENDIEQPDAIMHRAIAARLKYFAISKLNLQFADNAPARVMSKPTGRPGANSNLVTL